MSLNGVSSLEVGNLCTPHSENAINIMEEKNIQH